MRSPNHERMIHLKTDLSRYVRFYQSISLDEDDAETKERVIQSACDGGSLWYEQPTPVEWLFRWSDCLYAGELPDGTFEILEPEGR